MATIQEMQKARDLMKTQGLDLKTAVAQARTPVTATSQINQDRLAQNQANRQANPITPVAPTPTTPAPIVQAPVDPNTGLSKPLEPVAQPVPSLIGTKGTELPSKLDSTDQTTIDRMTAEGRFGNIPGSEQNVLKGQVENVQKPVVASKIEAPIDYNQSKGREQDIINNLNTFKAQNMTPEQIMKASDYQNATPEKKALIEPYLKQQVPTASAMYNNIVAKADIPDEQKTSLPYKIANNRYMKANMYSTMTPSQLSSEMTNSKLIQGSQAYEDLKAMNPKLVQDTENLRIVNGSKNNLFTYVNNPDGTSTKTNNLEKTFAEDYMDNFKEAIQQMFTVQTPEQIRAIIRTPDAAQAEDKAFELEGKIDEIDKLIEDSDKKVEESLAGSGASGQRIQLEKQAQKEKLEKEKRSIEKDYTRYVNKANNIITQNTSLYLNSQQQKQAQNTAMLPFITDQYKTAQAKAQAEQALQDPATAIKSVIDEYKKLGIPFTSTVQSRLAEFKASGKPLEQFLTEMGQNIQASPAYQKYQAQQAGKGISYQTIGDSVYRQNADGSLTKTDISAAKAKDAVREETPWEIVTIDGKSKERNKYTGETREISVTGSTTGTYNPRTDSLATLTLENGKPIKMLSEPANALATLINGNPDVKIDYNNLYREQADQFRLYGKGRTSEQLMKEGIPSLYADPTSKQVTWTTKSQHMTGTAVDLVKPTPETIAKMNSAGFFQPADTMKMGDTGHFEYVGGKKDGKEINKFNDSDIALLGAVTKLDKQGRETLKENGFTEKDWANFNAGLLPPTARQKQDAQTIVGKVDDIFAGDWTDAVGTLLGKSRIFTGDASDRRVTELKVNALKDLLAMANLDKIKGAMSDKDIEFLRNTATYLSTELSESEFEKTLNEIKNKYATIVGGTPTTTSTPATPTNTGGGQTDAILNKWYSR